MRAKLFTTIKNGAIVLSLAALIVMGIVYVGDELRQSDTVAKYTQASTLSTAQIPKVDPDKDKVEEKVSEPKSAYQLTGRYPVINTDLESPFVAVAEKLRPSVVNISVLKKRTANPHENLFRQFFPFREMPESQDMPAPKPRPLGTGLIISKDGHIVTNNHVVADAEEIIVMLDDGEQHEAEVIGLDPETDLALIDIGNVDENRVAELGDSDKIRIGDWAVAMGNAYGLDWSLTVGVISALGRSGFIFGGGTGPSFQDFIQTDASINPGNSGGPLTNIRGQVIGINSAMRGNAENIGFAIPINMVREVIEQLNKSGRVARGYLGMRPDTLTPLLKESLDLDQMTQGVFVGSVEPNTPAEDGGLEISDVIVKVNGEKVKDVTDFRFKVARQKPGDTVELVILRNGKEKTLKFKLGDRADYLNLAVNTPKQSKANDAWMGIVAVSLDNPRAQRFDLDAQSGVLVLGVDNDSPARGKLKSGDVIFKVGRSNVDTIEEWKDVTKRLGDTKTAVLIWFYRDGQSQFAPIKP